MIDGARHPSTVFAYEASNLRTQYIHNLMLSSDNAGFGDYVYEWHAY